MTSRDLSPAAEARVLPFRRPASAVRVRRRSPWVILGRHFAQALLLVGGPVGIGFWLFSSPTFALAHLGIDGDHYVDRAWVDRTLAPLVGENLFALPLPQVEEMLAANPWVEGVTVEKRLPNALRVALVERRPAALLRDGLSLVYLDAEGRPIATFDPARGPADLLLISLSPESGASPGAAFEVAREFAAVEPSWAASLSEIEVLGDGDFRLYLGALTFPLLVRGGTLRERVGELKRLLPMLENRYPKLAFIDLRFDRRIIFQPAL